MKKILALLLVVAMLLPMLCGCSIRLPFELPFDLPFDGPGMAATTAPTEGNICLAELPKTPADPLQLSGEAQNALAHALILMANSAIVCMNGEIVMLDSALPTYVEDILLLPALALAQYLGAQISREENTVTLGLDGRVVTLTAGSKTLPASGKELPLPIEVTPEKNDLLVSAAELCDALGQALVIKEDLIFVSPQAAVLEKEDSNGMALISSALHSELSCRDAEIAALGAVATGDGYFARADRSACLTLTADMVPYTAANGETIAVAGSLFVEDLLVEPSPIGDNYYRCSMTVYNTGYTFGSVEAFDKDDSLIEFERIKPFEGQKASVTKALTDLVVLGTDIYQAIDNGSWAELDYRSSLNASKTTVTLDIPADGYIFVTCNPMHSERVAVYNAVHTFTTLATAAQDLFKSKGNADAQAKLTDYIADQILKDPNMVSEIAMEFGKILSDVPTTPVNPADYAKKLSEKMLDMFQRCDFKFTDALKDAAKDAGTGAIDKSAEKYITKLLPVTQAAFTAWNISYTSSNLVCLFMDLAYCVKTRSVIIEIGDWRAAYAQLLRERGNKGGERFVLGYVNGDGIPDLMVTYAFAHYGSYVEFYTYQKRQVQKITDEHGNQQLGVAYGTFHYAQFHSVLMRGNLHMGITSTNYMHIIDNVITSTEVFYDTELTGEKAEYHYNGESVAKIYYNWKLNSFRKEYEEDMICVNGGSDGWSISEENIKEVLKR